MQTLTLYKYKERKSTIVTPTVPTGVEYTTSEYVRLVADEGMALTDGETTATVIDTLEPSLWTEIEAPDTDKIYENLTEEQAEYIKAGKILMGEEA